MTTPPRGDAPPPAIRDVPRRSILLATLAVALSAACRRAPRDASPEDAALPKPRIVSVGSAVTETLFALGAGDDVVAVDTSSLFPEAATKLPQVGYQRALSAEGILALAPTIVIGTNDAGPPAVLEQLRSAGVRLEMADAEPVVEGARARVKRVAEIVGRDPSEVLRALDEDLARAKRARDGATSRPKALVLYARGGGALHVFGEKTTAAAILDLAGGENVVTGFTGTKPLTSEALAAAAPEVIVIPSRGLASIGGEEGLLAVPGVATTPAGKGRRFVVQDDLLLLGLGPRTGKGALELGDKLRSSAKGAP